MAGSAIQSLPLTEEAISARLERLPLTSWYRRIMLIVGMAGFFDAFDALTIAFVLPVLIPLWHIEPGQIGALISIGYVGQLIGALGLSWMAERYGRLSVLRWSIAIYALFNLACAFAWSYDSLFWLRFVQGLGLGAEVPIAATYMNEFTRAELRGRLVLLFQAIFAFGVMITALVAVWVVPNLGWQWMFVIGALPALLAVGLRRLVPESPRWLAAHGRLQEADQTLARIEDSVVKDGVQPIPPLPSNIPSIVKEKAHWRDLFGRDYLRRTLTAWGMAFTTSIVGYGLLAWLPTIYRNIYHLPLSQNLQYSFVSYSVGLFGALFGMLLIDRFGRRPCYTVSFLGAGDPAVGVMVAQPWNPRASGDGGDVSLHRALLHFDFAGGHLRLLAGNLSDADAGDGQWCCQFLVACRLDRRTGDRRLHSWRIRPSDCVPVFWRRRCRRCTDRDDLRNRDQSQGSRRDRAMTCNGRPGNSWSLATRIS